MNTNYAQKAGYTDQIIHDWTNPNAASGFASLSSGQVQKMFKKCNKKHGKKLSKTGSGGVHSGTLCWLEERPVGNEGGHITVLVCDN